ncbi:MAG: serine protease [Hyphomicrobiales bacterium]|jgi:hypothetical protein
MTDEPLKAELREQLKSRLTTTDLIDDLLRKATGVRLFDEYATDQTPRNKAIRILVDAMDDEGTLILFLRQVYRASPGRPELRSWLDAHFPGVDAPTEIAPAFDFQVRGRAAPSVQDRSGGLQRFVRPRLENVDILSWFATGLDVARRVCRIELNRNGLGTGFLVGRDVVLTNWHVVRDLVPGNSTGDLACRFDFAVAPGGGTQDGADYDVAAKGILAWSPAAASEMPERPGLPPLGPDTLDYALLKLDEPVGLKRGWLDLETEAPALAVQDPVLIVQHPFGAPLKLAMDTDAVLDPIPPGLRLRYATNTEHGSSGAPVLTMDWRLVALHHLGDPAPAKPNYNEGIPIGLVRDQLRAKGQGDLIRAP